ncbi:hypothetical protein DPMN_130927 [Dreissena polymorpha]|uniref:Uncharacterized protein n=1 Tax=Dreissena polymorpha TaxID=45954 RepID=A0A9D4H5Z9_DREPO|nr:hypothetical protein DPMN_130927 [Dreissena polymorpha]
MVPVRAPNEKKSKPPPVCCGAPPRAAMGAETAAADGTGWAYTAARQATRRTMAN